jgi:hypothetical protein
MVAGFLRRVGRLLMAAATSGLLLATWAGSASALTLAYDVVDGTAGVFAAAGGSLFVVSQNLNGSIALETPGNLEIGAVLEYTGFMMAGTGQLCAACDEIGIEMVLDGSLSSTLEVVDDPIEPGTFASEGELFTIWTLSGDFGSLDLAVSAVTRFFGSRNDVSSTFFSHNYRITSITPLGPIPDGLDLSNLEVFKFNAQVPEPGTLLLTVGGLTALAAFRRRAA